MKVTRELRGQVYTKANGHCAYCGVSLDPFEDWHIDHVLPVPIDNNSIENLVAACKLCNLRKKNQSPDGFKDAIKGRAVKLLDRIDTSYYDKKTGAKLDELIASVKYTIEQTKIRFYAEGDADGKLPD